MNLDARVNPRVRYMSIISTSKNIDIQDTIDYLRDGITILRHSIMLGVAVGVFSLTRYDF